MISDSLHHSVHIYLKWLGANQPAELHNMKRQAWLWYQNTRPAGGFMDGRVLGMVNHARLIQ